MTLDEFLELPETEPPSEFVCGRIIPKPMPTWFHSRLAARLARFFDVYLDAHDVGFVNVELRHAQRSEGRAYLPDVSFTRWSRSPLDDDGRRGGAVETPPDIAIEITSPEDRPGRVADKLAFYLRNNVPLVWIVDPEDRTVAVYEPARPVRLLTESDILDCAPVLPDLELSLKEVFSVLDRGRPGGS